MCAESADDKAVNHVPGTWKCEAYCEVTVRETRDGDITSRELVTKQDGSRPTTPLAFQGRADLLFIAEQYSNLPGLKWYADTTNTAAIGAKSRDAILVANFGMGGGFLWVASSWATFCSIYFSPNEGFSVFRQELEQLEEAIRNSDGKVIVAGDFDAKSQEEGKA